MRLGKYEAACFRPCTFRSTICTRPMAPTADCKFGMRCTRPDCTFNHPQGRAIDKPSGAVEEQEWVACGKFGARRCRDGAGCRNAQCGFAHPVSWVHFHGEHSAAAAATTVQNVSSAAAATVNPGGFGRGFADASSTPPPGGPPPMPPPPSGWRPPMCLPTGPPLQPQLTQPPPAPPVVVRKVAEEVESLDDF